jgi:aromatic-L-amino-acid/L-tryptophan decarboxylase
MTNIEFGDLTPDQFREQGHAVVEWIARYLENPAQYPVLSSVKPGEIRAGLPATPPAKPESLAEILVDFEEKILPGVTHWNHPGFLAYFAISSSVPGILAEMLSAALNVNGMLWKTSPSATELEQVAMDWLRQMLGLGNNWFGMINDTASVTAVIALAAAREAKAELGIRQKGMAGRDLPRLRVYTSEHSHSSIDKGAITVGIGHENVVHIGADEQFRMRPDLLEAAIAADKAAGYLPLAVIATVGTTSTTSIDPVRAIGEIAKREELWFHVDGAYGGVAAIVPELQSYIDGIELADSFILNPHKWLFTPIDLSAFFTQRPDIVKRAFSLVPEYLVTQEQDDVVNFMDYGVQLGRRFRALKLWMVIRAFGTEGLAARLRGHNQMAQEFAGWVDEASDWERLAPVPFSVVCFRYVPAGKSHEELNTLNEAIMNRVNQSGEVYLSHTKLNDRYTIRLAVGNIHTTRHHIARAWELLQQAGAEV